MEHKVLRMFKDIESGAIYVPGSFYVSIDVKRVKQLEENGFIKGNENLSALEVEKTARKTRKKASD